MIRHALLLLSLLLPTTALAEEADSLGGQFVSRVVQLDGQAHRYQVFVPRQREVPAPIILFLHGSGERGSDGDAPTRAGIGPWLRRHGRDFPALVVFPQAPADQEWLGPNLALALATLDAASDEFSADRQRTYLTGMSMGGYGAWELALTQPERFAALVPICAALHAPRPARPTLRVEQAMTAADPYRYTLEHLRHVPVWMFHGALDDLVPPTDARRLHQTAVQLGTDVRYTEYPDANHNAWDRTYADPALWHWLFSQRRK